VRIPSRKVPRAVHVFLITLVMKVMSVFQIYVLNLKIQEIQVTQETLEKKKVENIAKNKTEIIFF